MKIAFNYKGDMIVRDATNKPKVYLCEEKDIIATAIYKWIQKKTPLVYEYKTSIEV